MFLSPTDNSSVKEPEPVLNELRFKRRTPSDVARPRLLQFLYQSRTVCVLVREF